MKVSHNLNVYELGSKMGLNLPKMLKKFKKKCSLKEPCPLKKDVVNLTLNYFSEHIFYFFTIFCENFSSFGLSSIELGD